MLSQKENGYELEIDDSKMIFDKTGEFRAFIGIPNEKYRKHLLNIVFEDKFELLTNPFTKSIIQTLIKDLKESKLDNSTLKDQLQRFELEIDDLTNQLNQKSETIEKVEKIKGGEDGRFVEENIYRLLLHCYGTNMSKGGFLASSLLKQLLKTKLGEIDDGKIDATVDLVIALPKIISNKEPTDDDKKLILLTSRTFKESSTGFIIIPPPIPQIAPITDATKLTIKKNTIIFIYQDILSICNNRY